MLTAEETQILSSDSDWLISFRNADRSGNTLRVSL